MASMFFLFRYYGNPITNAWGLPSRLMIDTTSPAGRALFTMISAFAQFERDIISERVKSGIDRARAQGKRPGRPPRPELEKQKIRKLRQQGLSYSQITKRTGIPRSTVSVILGKKKKKK